MLRRWEYYKIIWFYQLSWQCKLATVKRFESWRFERYPFVGANRNVSFRISLRWLTYIVNSVDKTKLSMKWKCALHISRQNTGPRAKARPQHRELLSLTLLNFHFYVETIPINWIKRSTFLLAVNTWRQSIPADKTRLKPDTNLPTSVQAAHKVWLYVIPQISWTVLPLGWKTLNLELNFIDNEN